MARRIRYKSQRRFVNKDDFICNPMEPKWKNPLPDDDLIELDDVDDDDAEVDNGLNVGVDEEDSDIILDSKQLPVFRNKTVHPIQQHCAAPGFGYPIWERRVTLIGETRLDINCSNRSVRLVPTQVLFTSPPTLDRQIIVCGSVVARLLHTGSGTRRVALPFQAVYSAWPVRNNDHVVEDLLCITGSRACPTLVTSPNGRIHRVCELKVVFNALVRVFHRSHYLTSHW